MEAIIKRSAGLDVHKMMVMASIILEQEDGSLHEETKEFGTFPKEPRNLARWLKDHQVERVVMESTGVYWKAVYRTLERKGVQAYLVNARHIKQVPGRKTDVLDSQWLAQLGRFGLVRPSFIPPRDLADLRLLSRYRLKLQGMSASEKNRLHKTLDDAGIRLEGVVSDIDGLSAREIIRGLLEGKDGESLAEIAHGVLRKKTTQLKACLEEGLSPRHKLAIAMIHHHMDFLEQEINSLEDYLINAMEPYQLQWKLLQTIPGIDGLAAATIIIEIGVDMHRFCSLRQFTSWAGLCPGNNESAGKRKSGRMRKGNQTLRWILCEVAQAARWTKSQFKGEFKALMIRRGNRRSVMALAHKILRVIFAVLRDLKPCKDPGVDYQAQMVSKNAPRWLKALEQYGFLELVTVASVA